MPGRPWSIEEDDAIREACAANRTTGLTDMDGGARNPRWRARRLHAVADRFGRTLAAVRKRAQRLGERSYRPSWSRAPEAAREFYRTDDLSAVNEFFADRGSEGEGRP